MNNGIVALINKRKSAGIDDSSGDSVRSNSTDGDSASLDEFRQTLDEINGKLDQIISALELENKEDQSEGGSESGQTKPVLSKSMGE